MFLALWYTSKSMADIENLRARLVAEGRVPEGISLSGVAMFAYMTEMSRTRRALRSARERAGDTAVRINIALCEERLEEHLGRLDSLVDGMTGLPGGELVDRLYAVAGLGATFSDVYASYAESACTAPDIADNFHLCAYYLTRFTEHACEDLILARATH